MMMMSRQPNRNPASPAPGRHHHRWRVQVITALVMALGLLAAGFLKWTPASLGTANAALKPVNVFWLRPSDVPFDQRYPDGITKVMVEAQRYYKQELGKTFQLNSPVVQVVEGQHPKSWYETNGGGDDYTRRLMQKP